MSFQNAEKSQAFVLSNLPMEIAQLLNKQGKFPLLFKRTLDVVGALIGLIVLSPLLLLLALIIKLTSNGSVFFSQTRVGEKGKVFKMYKFRSMVTNAEILKISLVGKNEQEGPVFKIKNDPRITPIGKIIRKYSLDELPQLLNVLVGDMSLVGPRPALPKEVEKYNDFHKLRLAMRPGLTCIWQVSGRNKIGFEDWMKMDVKYIKSWSLWLDIKLLLKTVRVVITGDGAY
jgi:exopolysaccharide biosynthesis polyprenyl glycosylphosphotransferase